MSRRDSSQAPRLVDGAKRGCGVLSLVVGLAIVTGLVQQVVTSF